MSEGPRVLLVSDDDDVAQPLVVALRRAGYRVRRVTGGDASHDLDGELPEVLIVDRDLPAGVRRGLARRLAPQADRSPFPLMVLGDAASEKDDLVPPDWHEDAVLVLSRPARPDELLTAVRALLRLSFYRTYRDLVHDLSQPVTVLHALSNALAREVPADAPHHDQVIRLRDEAERMLSLMDRFQRRRAASDR